MAQRSRSLSTKNGKVGSASDAESVGMNVRVIADGAWGFAASAELGRGAVEATAAEAVAIARASARGKREKGRLAEANLNFNRDEQWFASSEGAEIHQTKLSTGAGYAAYAFAGNEIQKRSYP